MCMDQRLRHNGRFDGGAGAIPKVQGFSFAAMIGMSRAVQSRLAFAECLMSNSTIGKICVARECGQE